MKSQMKGSELPLLERIDEALRRVTNGEATMRVPVEATDPDIVLADCAKALKELSWYFVSGNGVPVERATIMAKDFWKIMEVTPNIQIDGGAAVSASQSNAVLGGKTKENDK